ncbi:uncharacterized protein LOC122014610 [Zingiber officinale]|uniref:uncharacterized protein LOC122014610 n=1 Tax=Zingiber officinale TaxID=94328 RepID=UPI001C4C1FA9|nr:uncharacterized protein LOC122014610 [Zingiber officinale]
MRLRPKLPRFLPSLLVSRLLADAAGIFQFLPVFGFRCWRRRGLLIPWRLPIAAPPRHRPAIRPDLAGFHQSKFDRELDLNCWFCKRSRILGCSNLFNKFSKRPVDGLESRT